MKLSLRKKENVTGVCYLSNFLWSNASAVSCKLLRVLKEFLCFPMILSKAPLHQWAYKTDTTFTIKTGCLTSFNSDRSQLHFPNFNIALTVYRLDHHTNFTPPGWTPRQHGTLKLHDLRKHATEHCALTNHQRCLGKKWRGEWESMLEMPVTLCTFLRRCVCMH